MSTEEMGLVPTQRLENSLNSHLVFQDDALRFNCAAPAAQRRVGVGGGGGGEVPKTRDLSNFIDERFFAPPSAADFRRSIYGGGRDRRDPPEAGEWRGNCAAATPSVDGSDDDDVDDDDDDEDDDVDDDDDEVVADDGGKGNSGNDGSTGEVKIGNGKQKHHNQSQSQSQSHNHHFGMSMIVGSSSRDVIVKESGIVQQTGKSSPNRHDHHHHRLGGFHPNAVTVAENGVGSGGDGYYSQYFQGAEGGSGTVVQKDLGADNGCGFSGRKDGSCSNESGDSLRTILSDPVSGAIMDDAMILPCGHSFGAGGIQHVIRMKSCYTCSQSISEDSIAPNLSLRAAVQAFRREDELQFQRSSKRKRERFDQEKSVYSDPALMELPRGRGVQFPFAVTDRVIIKGNKRTPLRFVGREAVVTTQCLNGWYVVKTLDNAESVKLQYRSLTKVPNDPLSKPMSTKMAPNWL